MNRLQTLKRALMSVSVGIKNLLSRNWQDYIYFKNVTVEKMTNGAKGTVTSLTGGYNTYMHFLIFENPQWGKTYTLTCNVEESMAGMDNAMRVGYWRSTVTTWKNIKEISINKGSSVYTVTFTLPAEKPEDFREMTDINYGGFRLFFNIQKTTGLTEYGSITVTDIFITQDD